MTFDPRSDPAASATIAGSAAHAAMPGTAPSGPAIADTPLTALMDGADTAMALLDRDLRYVRCNRPLERLLGLNGARLLGRRLDEVVDLTGQPEVMRSLLRMRNNQTRAAQQMQYRYGAGDFPWIREQRTALHDAAGHFRGIFLLAERVDEERHTQAALTGLRDALERAGQMALEVRADGTIANANAAACGWLGYSSEQLIGLRIDAIDGNLDPAHFAHLCDVLRERGSYQGEARYRTRQGGEFPVDVVLQRVQDDEHEYFHVLVRERDMEKGAERPGSGNGEHLLTIFNESPVGMVLLDGKFGIRRINPAACALLCQRESQLLGRDPVRLLHPDDVEASLHERERLIEPGASVIENDRRLVDPSGNEIWVNLVWRALGHADGQPEFLLVLENTTERRRFEARQARLHAESRLIFDTALVGLLFVRDGRVVRVNSAMEELLGCEPGTLVEQIQLFAHPSDRLLLDALSERFASIAEKGACEFELYMYRRRGDPIWVAVQGRAVNSERPEFGYIFAFVNIDQRKRADRELRAALNELQLIFDNALVAIIYVANDLVIKANAAGERLFGLGPADLSEVQFSELFCDPVAWQQVLQRCAAPPAVARDLAGFELPMRRADGSSFWCAGNVRPIEAGALERGVIVALTDVDARHRSEEELHRVRNHLDLVIESLPVLVSVREAGSGRFVSMNRAGETITGLAREQVIGRTWHEIYGRRFADLYAQMDRKAIAEAQQIERPRDLMLRADGRTLTVHQRVVPIFDETKEGRGHGTAQYVMSIIDDLTGEVLAEAALRETESRFRQFAENIDQIVFIANAELSKLAYVNERSIPLLGASPAALLADAAAARPHVLAEDLAEFDRRLPRLIAGLRRLRRAEFSVRVRPAEGEVRLLQVRLNPARIHDGSIRVFGIADDVTLSKAAEQQRLAEAVQQRDVLVREVHHRIKNNLQGVAGLLQQMASAKPEVGATLNEAAGQIQAIAQVHGLQIGAGGMLPVLGVAKGIFANLGAMFGAEVRFAPDSPGLGVWGLPENEAVPLALVINELGTNAIKYRSSRELPIEVRLEGRADGITLLMENPGHLPAGFALARISSGVSGLSLIKALLPRRGATLSIEQDGALVRTKLELRAPAIRGEEQ